VHERILAARIADGPVTTCLLPLLGDRQRAPNPDPEDVRGRQGLAKSGWLLGNEPDIIDHLVKSALRACCPVRVAGPDHAKADRAYDNVEGMLPVYRGRDPAEAVHVAPVQGKELLALRRQEGVDARYLQRPWPEVLESRW
jgi:hypothetical protein